MERIELNVDPPFGGRYRISVDRLDPEVFEESEYRATYCPFHGDDQPIVTLPEDTGRRLWSLVADLKLSPAKTYVMGLDGITYSLTVEAGFTRCEFSWWCDLPPEWMEMQGLVDALIQLARDLEIPTYLG
jgi:hypothetical protein